MAKNGVKIQADFVEFDFQIELTPIESWIISINMEIYTSSKQNHINMYDTIIHVFLFGSPNDLLL